MTAPQPEPAVAKCLEHERCRCSRTRIRGQRARMLVIGRLDPLVFLDAPQPRDRDADAEWNRIVEP